MGREQFFHLAADLVEFGYRGFLGPPTENLLAVQRKPVRAIFAGLEKKLAGEERELHARRPLFLRTTADS